MANVGTLMSWDTLLQSQATLTQAGGEQAVYDYIANRIALQNGLVQEGLSLLTQPTDEYHVPAYGNTTGTMEMVELGETGTPFSQKVSIETGDLGFPLKRFGILIQWDQDYLDNVTVSELGIQTDNALLADMVTLWIELRRTLFGYANYTFKDKIGGTRLSLPVKGFVNTDGANIPPSPTGRTFDGAAHTHYLATASLVAGNISALVDTVLEHYNTGQLFLYVNKQEGDLIKGMANFKAYSPTYLTTAPASTNVYAVGGVITSADLMDPYNQEIGVWDGVARVVVKPWMPASYIFCFNAGQRKPLAMRRPRKTYGTNFRLVAEYTNYPLHARRWQREFGFGVQERVNGAILYTGGGTYVIPTFTS